MDSEYKGNNLEEWLCHYKFSDACINVLKIELGVSELIDLREIFYDSSLLDTLKSELKPIEFTRFLRAAQNTKVLKDAGVVFPSIIPPSMTLSSTLRATSTVLPPPPTSIPTHSAMLPPPPSTSTIEKELLAKIKMEKLKAASLKSTSTSIHDLEKELARLEALTMEKSRLKEKKDSAMKMKMKIHKTLERRKLISDLDLDSIASLDLLITMDCTGSMASYIASAKNQIYELVTALDTIYPHIPLRIAFVGYRDYCDGANRLSVLEFTTSIKEFQDFVGKQSATGGGDEAEDVFGALNVATNLNWVSASRIMFHIADSPCHGTEFHDGCGDNHPTGDIHGLDAKTLLTKMKSLNIEYNFGKITEKTNKMIDRFNEIMGGAFVSTLSMKAESMITIMSRSISVSISASLATSSRSIGGTEKMREVVIDPAIPKWSSIPLVQAMRFRIILPTSIEEIISASEDKYVHDSPEGSLVSIMCPKNPFAKGASRASYYCQTVAPEEVVVLKQLMYEKASKLDKAHYDTNLASHVVAMVFAKVFNKIKPKGTAEIEYTEPCLLQFPTSPDMPYFIQEKMINGTFEKYNTNSGFCQPFPTEHGTDHSVVQAFSHWTHHVTKGYLMIVDIQGAFNRTRNAFELTDPAIHSTSLIRFGGTNLGTRGYDRFFATHRCNGTCHAMGLTMPASK